MDLSIVVPSWNSLDYLKILFKSLQTNVTIPFEFLVHDNASMDGTEQWLIENKINYTISDKNQGFCGVNNVLEIVNTKYVMIFNSDMYVLPDAIETIFKQIKVFELNKIDRFTISSCLIEPVGNNPEYKIFDAGCNFKSFNEELLLKEYKQNRSNYSTYNSIQYSHPILFPTFMIKEIGYLDEDFFPGWSVDHWMPWAFAQKGCKNFVMLTNSRVYHFSSKTFSKLPNEIRNQDGQDLFYKKTGIGVQDFRSILNLKQPFRMRR